MPTVLPWALGSMNLLYVLMDLSILAISWNCICEGINNSFINAMISRSFQVLAPVRTPFLPMDEWFIMCRHLFIHSFSNRHLDWSRFLAIVKVIYRDSRQVFDLIHIFYSLGYTLSSRVPGSDSNSVINLWESCLIDTLATLLSSMGTGGCTASGSPH